MLCSGELRSAIEESSFLDTPGMPYSFRLAKGTRFCLIGYNLVSFVENHRGECDILSPLFFFVMKVNDHYE
jgi:hypothetical protein